MGRYKKSTPRLSVKFFDGETNEQLFEIKDRSWMDVGELFADHYVSELITQTIREQDLPETAIVLVTALYDLN